MHYIPGLRLRASEEAEIHGIDDAKMGEFACMEYATEFRCNNYILYGVRMPDSESDFTWTGHDLQFLGASAHIQHYVDSAGTPPSHSSCINWRGAAGKCYL
ncbi:hypothetical protein CVT24_002317 [Panaeolus cyanescens]|uniref:Uncharacterized protein n=1 Tax=Panaeolus cyanescens TaxID=181874 RepID=A0A409WV55_9AGAR|nr:hypothetical protein CVT24_002317 [Panaeolus cyanescens]